MVMFLMKFAVLTALIISIPIHFARAALGIDAITHIIGGIVDIALVILLCIIFMRSKTC